MTRILHWYPNFLGGGGVANAVLGLSVSQARLGADVAVAAAKLAGPPLYEQMGGGSGVTLIEWEPAWTLRCRGVVLRHISRGAARRLRAFHPDVVHVHGELNPDNLWVPHLFECPIVLSPHGGLRSVLGSKTRPLKMLYFLMARTLLYRRARAIHALTPIEGEHVKRLLPGSRVLCIPEGPNIRIAFSETYPDRRWSGEGVKFVFVGRLDVATKGLDILLEAFAAVKGRLADERVTLALVGPDWKGGMAWLQNRGRQLGIADSMVFTGALSGEEVASVLVHSDVYVQLSRHDSFGLSVAEALLAGMPSILSGNIGSTSYPEVASLPHVRVVAPIAEEAADAMIEFVRCMDGLRNVAQQCRLRVSNFFSWERIARLQLELYSDVIVRRGQYQSDLVSRGSLAG